MKKSKILGIALAAAMITSISAISVSALDSAEVKNHTVGICGIFTNWGNTNDDGTQTPDIAMTDDDGDGIYEGEVFIENVTEAMITEAQTDPGTGEKVSRGFSGVQFKVRLDQKWDESGNWGDYEDAYERTCNSQTNCCVKEAVAGQPLKFIVKFDTTKSSVPDVIPDDDDDVYNVWAVTYEVVDAGTTPVVESSEESTVVESSEESTVVESSEAAPVESSEAAPAVESSEDATTPSTGDTTSAVALVAVVIASLGAAVVMTKKAKE